MAARAVAVIWVAALEGGLVAGSQEAVGRAADLVAAVADMELAPEAAMAVQAGGTKPLVRNQGSMASGVFRIKRAMFDPLAQEPQSPI